MFKFELIDTGHEGELRGERPDESWSRGLSYLVRRRLLKG